MKKAKYLLLSNLIFLVHVAVVFIIVFGWYYPALQTLNLIITALTLLAEIIFGYCPLTRWEF